MADTELEENIESQYVFDDSSLSDSERSLIALARENNLVTEIELENIYKSTKIISHAIDLLVAAHNVTDDIKDEFKEFLAVRLNALDAREILKKEQEQRSIYFEMFEAHRKPKSSAIKADVIHIYNSQKPHVEDHMLVAANPKKKYALILKASKNSSSVMPQSTHFDILRAYLDFLYDKIPLPAGFWNKPES